MALDVSDWQVAEIEPLGRERKVWLQGPGSNPDSRSARWLFKPVVVATNGHRQGEDWVEKVVSDLGEALGVSCAQVELVTRGGVDGSISKNVAPDGWNLVLGEVLLTTPDGSYVGGSAAPRGRPGHNPAAIMAALRDVGTLDPGYAGAFTMFCGYLVLDAWIANQDRHDQNWGVLRKATPPERRVLAPSFEHDPALPPAARPTLVAVAHEALGLAGQDVHAYWLDRLAALPRSEVEAIVRNTPRMSEVAARFVVELLEINRRRLLR